MSRTSRGRIWHLAFASAVTGCGLVAGLPDWRLATDGTDGGLTDASADGGGAADTTTDDRLVPPIDATDVDAQSDLCDPLAPFSSPVAVSELNSAADDIGARLSSDERTVYFSSDRLGGSAPTHYRVFTATRSSRSANFGTPAPVSELDLPNHGEYSPTMTADGLALFLTGVDTNGLGIFVSTRGATNAAFGTPALVAGLTAGFFHPYVSPTGLRLLLTDGATISEALFASPTQAPTSVTPVPFVSTPGGGFQAPVMSADRKVFYGSNQSNIWRSQRATDNVSFASPVVVPELSEPNANNTVLWISSDNCRIYIGRQSGATGMDIFMAERLKPAPGGD